MRVEATRAGAPDGHFGIFMDCIVMYGHFWVLKWVLICICGDSNVFLGMNMDFVWIFVFIKMVVVKIYLWYLWIYY